MSNDPEDEFVYRRDLIDALSSEISSQRADYTSRNATMSTRLSILIATASLATGLQVAQGSPKGWFVLAAGAGAVAAVCGVIGIWPRAGGENEIEALERELYKKTHPDEAAHVLMHRRLDVLKKDEKALKGRRIWASIGFVALAASIVFIVLHVTGVKPLF